MSGRDALGEFLGEQAAMRSNPETCCGIMLADWFRRVRGFKPLIVGRRSGLFRAVCRTARRLGLATTDHPIRGDVGLVRAGNTTFGAVFTGTAWAAKSPLGVVILKRVEILRAWRV